MGLKRLKFRGFTLAEVVIGFVLLSSIVTMVCAVVTSMYTLASKLKELPNTYYGAQDETERGLDELSTKVKRKYRLLNEVNNTDPARLDPSVPVDLAAVNHELATYTTETFTLFGKDIELYKFDVDYVSATDQKITFHAGVINAEQPERLVPIIDNVEIGEAGGGVVNEIFFADGREIEVSAIDYNEKNNTYIYDEQYQWSVCQGGFHTALYADGAHFDQEPQYNNTVYSAYPNQFYDLSSQKSSSIRIDSSFYGKMLVCVVQPLSKNGAIGESVVSNYLYVSALPKLSTGSYRMLIDASMSTYSYAPGGWLGLPSIESRLPSGCSLVSSGSVDPRVSLNGEATDTRIADSVTGEGTYSRYISFSDSSAMQSRSFSSSGETTVFAVAKNNDFSAVDFIFMAGTPLGFATNTRATSGSGDTGWQIIEAVVPSAGSIEVGGCAVDVAELVVVSNATAGERDEIWNYLSQKYHIT